MITFSFEKDIARFHSAWSEWKYSVYHKQTPRHYNLRIKGFYGCGKTEFLRQFCEQNKDAVYLNFNDLDSDTALSVFCKQLLNGENAENWNEAVKKYKKLTSGRFQVLFIDQCTESAASKDFASAIHSVKLHDHTLVLFAETSAPESIQDPGNIKPRSIADYLRVFPDYDKADVIRLYGLTGGLPAVAKELDASLSFEDNLKLLLRHDSAFSHFVPEILQRVFRTPESYHPILYSIACGKHRLSEIAKDIGFPNNKCGKYLEALRKAGLVKAQTEGNRGFARYFLTNSYLNSWYLYIYKNRALQITDPQRLLNMAVKTIDKAVALPALEDSCIRFIDNKWSIDSGNLIDRYIKGKTKPVKLKHKDGFRFKIDCILERNGKTLVCVFPHSFDEKITKEQMEHYINVSCSYGSLYGEVSLVVFSVNRFSDWCVHQASVYDQLFCVPLERLKY